MKEPTLSCNQVRGPHGQVFVRGVEIALLRPEAARTWQSGAGNHAVSSLDTPAAPQINRKRLFLIRPHVPSRPAQDAVFNSRNHYAFVRKLF